MSEISEVLTEYSESGQEAFEETYEVAHTVELVMGGTRFRIEVLKSYWNPSNPYTTRCWKEEALMVAGQREYHFATFAQPATMGDNVTDVLRSALSFLMESKPIGDNPIS